jgi:hypothetical protein
MRFANKTLLTLKCLIRHKAPDFLPPRSPRATELGERAKKDFLLFFPFSVALGGSR